MVVAPPAGQQRIAAGPADDDIRAVRAVDYVPSGTTLSPVLGARCTAERAGAEGDDVVTVLAIDPVVAGAAYQRVGPRPSPDFVVAA